MNNLLHWFASDEWSCLVLVLCHSIWQGGIIALVLWTVLHRLPARKANARYAASLLSLAALLFCIFITSSILDLRRPARVHPVPPNSNVLSEERKPREAASSALPAVGVEVKKAPANMASGSPGAVQNRADAASLSRGWMPWAALFWLTGCSLMSVRFFLQWIDLQRVAARCRRVTDPTIQTILKRYQELLGLRRVVLVLSGDSIVGPSVYGLIWPTLLLPPALLLGVPQEQLEAIIAHELAHIRRHDFLICLTQQLVETVLFFNPAVWWISRQIRLERETSCDNLAVKLTGQRDVYASALELCASHQAAYVPAQAFIGKQTPDGPLERLKRLLIAGYQPPVRLPLTSLLGATLLASILVSGLFQGTHMAVALASEILTPAQRLEKLAEIKKAYPPMEQSRVTFSSNDLVLVTGTLVDEKGMPIESEARVDIKSDGMGQGGFGASFPVKQGVIESQIAPGTIQISAVASNYAPGFLGSLEGKRGGKIEGIKVVMPSGYAAQVKAVDESGHPIANAEIECQYSSLDPNFSSQKATTGTNGIAVFGHLFTNAVHLCILAHGYEYEEGDLPYLNPGDPYVFKLVSAQKTQGRVVSAKTGQPVEGAQIYVAYCKGKYSHEYCGLDKMPKLAVSDKTGYFQLDTLNRAMSHTLWVYIEDGDYMTLHLFDVKCGQNLEAVLQAPIHIHGKVVGNMAGISEAHLHWADMSIDGQKCSASTSTPIKRQGGAGYFEFDQLDPRQVQLVIGKTSTNLNATQSIDNLVIDLNTAPQPEEKFPLYEVHLTARVPEGLPPVSGNFTYKNWSSKPPGRFEGKAKFTNGLARLQVREGGLNMDFESIPGYWIESIVRHIPASSNTLNIEVEAFPVGAIYGKVVAADGTELDGVTVMAAQVKAAKLGKKYGHLFQFGHNIATANAPTRFSAQCLPLGGEYVIFAHRDGSCAISPPILLTEAHPIEEITLKMPLGVTVAGQVFDYSGNPVILAEVSVRYEAGDSKSGNFFGFGLLSTKTDSEGRFQIRGMNPDVPGKYYLEIISVPGCQALTKAIDFKALPMNLRLEKGLILAGSVVDQTAGKPLAFAELKAYPESQGISSGILQTRTDAQGQFKFADARPIRYRLLLDRAETQDTWGEGGQTNPIVVRAKPFPGMSMAQ